MNLLKKINIGQFTFIAHCSSADKDEPEKIYTIVLNNGTIQQTLKIPAAYVDTKNERVKSENGLWVKFAYPSTNPVSSKHNNEFKHIQRKEEIVDVYIKVAANTDTLSMSEQTYESILRLLKKRPKKNQPLYIGKIGVYEIYEEDNPEHEFTITTYFTRDKESTFLSFRDDGYQVNALRRISGVLELSYFFPISLRPEQLQVDAEVVKLVDGWLQK